MDRFKHVDMFCKTSVLTVRSWTSADSFQAGGSGRIILRKTYEKIFTGSFHMQHNGLRLQFHS
jgi:hypothetical protein